MVPPKSRLPWHPSHTQRLGAAHGKHGSRAEVVMGWRAQQGLLSVVFLDHGACQYLVPEGHSVNLS